MSRSALPFAALVAVSLSSGGAFAAALPLFESHNLQFAPTVSSDIATRNNAPQPLACPGVEKPADLSPDACGYPAHEDVSKLKKSQDD